MKPVVLESPYAGKTAKDVVLHVAYARRCMLDCLRRGESPHVSHLLYTQVLDDRKAHQRRLGIDAGRAWLIGADLCVVYTDHGLTDGMQEGVRAAKKLGLEIDYRALDGPPEVPDEEWELDP